MGQTTSGLEERMSERRASSRGYLVVIVAAVGLLLVGRSPVRGAEGDAGSGPPARTSLEGRLRFEKPLGRASRLVCDLRELVRYTPVESRPQEARCLYGTLGRAVSPRSKP